LVLFGPQDSFISVEGLILALAKEDEKFTREALLKQGVKYNDLMQAVQKIREKNGPVISRGAEAMYEALLKYGIDFTERAREGKLDPVIGRDDEIRRAIQILSRRTKNNPVLIGDPGVGKVGSRKGAREGLLGVYETLDLTLYSVIDRRRLRKVSPSE
jgi:ATP-dependent Clp protease ATP-binding subunit ClpB